MAGLLNPRNVTRIVFITFVAAIIYVVAGIIFAPNTVNSPDMNIRVKFDYFVLFLQCAFALVALIAPEYVSRKFGISIPGAMIMIYALFIFAGILCGNVMRFYETVPHWDTLLHFFSGVLLCALGFSLIGSFNRSKGAILATNCVFAAIFALCFAVTLGVVWEVVELVLDLVLDINTQGYATVSGVPLVGQAALMDTMKDLVFDFLGAVIFAVYGYKSIKRDDTLLNKLIIKKSDDNAVT